MIVMMVKEKNGCTSLTTYIAYGADTKKSSLSDNSPKYMSWLTSNGLAAHKYLNTA